MGFDLGQSVYQQSFVVQLLSSLLLLRWIYSHSGSGKPQLNHSSPCGQHVGRVLALLLRSQE